MQSVDVAKFLDLIDDMLLYNPVPDKLTLETFIPIRSNQQSLKITKKLISGHLELVVSDGNIFGEYFLPGIEEPSGNFTIAPPSEDGDSIRSKLRPIIILDAKSQHIKTASPLDQFRPERQLQ
jgi:hypothetical protein